MYHSQRAGMVGGAASAAVAPVQSEEQFQQERIAFQSKVEVLIVDSAGDELLAGELSRGNAISPREESMLPGLDLIIRDVTHASRRLITHPHPPSPAGRELVSQMSRQWCRLGAPAVVL